MKFIQDNIWLVLVALASGTILVWPLISRKFSGAKEAGPMEVVQWMNRKEAVLVDVREPAEFGVGHPPGARNLPQSQLGQRLGELEKFKGKPVVLVCQSGARAHAAVAQFRKAGFGELAVLSGGFAAWQQANLPVEK